MKKLRMILMCLSVVILSVTGLCFLNINNFVMPTDIAVETSKIEYGNGENIDDDEEEITYTEKEYDEYFTNISIETITEADLTGTGSASDPYVVRSTNGFLYLTNQSVSKISLHNKYIELDCDVILNDETFDENGNPSGGDGKYYQWKRIMSTNNKTVFDGKNHRISGMYYDNTETESVGVSLFYSNMDVIKNVIMDNVFIKAYKTISPLHAGMINIVENVKTYGNVYAGADATGVVQTGFHRIANCENYVNLTQVDLDIAGGSFAGITQGNYGSSIERIENCVNYGKITYFNSSYVAGITMRSSNFLTNCTNFGEIKMVEHSKNGRNTGLGGIVAMLNNIALVENCDNYGEITNESTNTTGYRGAIVGYVAGSKMEVRNCNNYATCKHASAFVGGGYSYVSLDVNGAKNYGKIINCPVFIKVPSIMTTLTNCENHGEIVTNAGQQGILFGQMSGKLILNNCTVNGVVTGKASGSVFSIFGYNYSVFNLDVYNIKCDLDFAIDHNEINLFCYMVGSSNYVQSYNIRNSQIKISANENVLDVRVVSSITSTGSLNLENVVFDMEYKNNLSMYLVRRSQSGKLRVNNTIMREKCKGSANPNSLIDTKNTENLDIQSLIKEIKAENDAHKEFWGTSFAGYYVSWKTGKIGLLARDGIGLFQGEVNEDVLQRKGYKKREI